MPENPGIPLLFRDIFKNAYLPYRDPETLRAFLKIIDEFTYDHSERLGDAFEYLLSVLGSQGEAGQFRTPRHIIDFIVEVIDPKKNETVLDPACGTAGFLISSYKHILKVNADAKGNSILTPDEKGRLAQNFKGYDISPDMVRLSLVNLYLHGFADPHIAEYDTLTSQERWNEYADVILANPPFMSPKGGIRPHNRFSVQSKRSEVLFVDYMAEHLTPSGRAGIIVPEGIIFQSQTAYTQLRKMLVEEYLVAVVSLPAGVFNPYSGVKTSILILDKSLAKKSGTIAFFKIDNDGFGLGAQRREIEKNDLPQAQAEIGEYLRCLRAGESVVDLQPTLGLIVQKEKIAANGEYNLSGERYREGSVRRSAFPLRQFEDICTLKYGAALPKEKRIDGPYPVVGSNGITGYHNEYLVEGPAIIVGRKGSAGEITLIEQNCFPIDTTYYVKQTNPSESDIIFLFWMLKSLNLPDLRGGTGIPGLNRSDVYNAHQIPLPPLEVQKEIVAEIESYQKVIDGARAILDNYRPHIPIHPNWPMVEFGNIISILTDFTANGSFAGLKENVEYKRKEDFAILVRLTDLRANLKNKDQVFVSEHSYSYLNKSSLHGGEYLLANVGANIGDAYLMPSTDRPATLGPNMFLVKFTDKVMTEFIYYLTTSGYLKDRIVALSVSAAQPKINKSELRSIRVPLPSLETQQQIVGEIEAEQALVAANSELIARFEKKIQATLARVWGEDEPSPAEA
jgi:type I restriction enzyme M protein